MKKKSQLNIFSIFQIHFLQMKKPSVSGMLLSHLPLLFCGSPSITFGYS